MEEQDAFWGDKGKLSDDSSIRCKGNWLAARLRFVRSSAGDTGVARVSERLEPPQRELFLNPPILFVWSPIRNLYLIDEAIVQEVMGGHIEGMVDFGEAIASYDIGFLYRVFFRMGSPEFFRGKSHLIFNQYVSTGKLRTTTSPGEANTVVHELAMPRYMCRYGIAGYIRGSIKAAGGASIRVEHTRCVHNGDDACSYRARWR